MYVIYNKETMRVPLRVWATEDMIEESAIEQMKLIASLPVIGPHVALMPDGHKGVGACIGGVVPLKNAVICNLVGVDIGCSMTAIKTSFNGKLSKEVLEKIVERVPQEIPLGVGGKYKNPCDNLEMPQQERGPVTEDNYESARYQLGTLGAGNHFIEVQTDEEDNIWLMIHSGSRNLGNAICKHYAKLSKEFHKEWCIESPDNLEWLIADSDLGKAYLLEMKYAMEYARLNHANMSAKLCNVVKQVIKEHDGFELEFDEPIYVRHNYADLESHYGHNYWLHRKGAIRVREGELGVIPGSMGTNSYIVKGKGATESFMSASHGAGRTMSRTEFNKQTRVCDVEKSMEGIVHTAFRSDRRRKSEDPRALDLSEAPGAYKDIDLVIENQKDLIDVEVKLRPLASMKG